VVPNESFAVVAGVLDPFGRADNLAKNAFESQNYYVQPVFSYQPLRLPGQLSLAYNWTNKPLINFGAPFGVLSPGQVEQAIGALLGGPQTGLPVNSDRDSWLLIGNISQYLYVRNDPTTIAKKAPERPALGWDRYHGTAWIRAPRYK
jgi:porin